MPMVPFFERFPDIALRETRAATIVDNPYLPDGEYGFVDLYCDEDGCDCRRVLLLVLGPFSKEPLATINYGWESEGFYARWVGDSESARDATGASLDPLGRQTGYSEALLALFKEMIKDPEYDDRFKRHYELFKSAVPAEQARPVQRAPVNRAEKRRAKRRR
jgi:hypothetical protein